MGRSLRIMEGAAFVALFFLEIFERKLYLIPYSVPKKLFATFCLLW